MAGRARAQGNAGPPTRGRTQGRAARSRALARGRQAAKARALRVTALGHPLHASDRRREAYDSLKPAAAPGVEGPTWATDGAPRATTLRALADRLKRGASPAAPVARVSSPQAAGRPRPRGQPTLEDHSVQRATGAGRNAIDAEAWVGVSSGARPGRPPPPALAAVTVGRATRSLPWVLEAAMRGCDEALAQAWRVQCVAHRLGDQRVVRPRRPWRKAGVREDGQWRQQEEGTPQGGRARPLLALRSLHEVCDRWAAQGRRRHARGAGIIVRDGDAGRVGCQHRDAAEPLLSERRERCHRGHRALPPEKTRLRACGRSARERRQRRGPGHPEPVAVLGVPHRCGPPTRGQCTGRRCPLAKRRGQKRQEGQQTRRERLHWPIEQRGAWRKRVVLGHSRSSGGPRHRGRLWGFRERLLRDGCGPLRRRSQRQRLPWQRRYPRATQWLPAPHMLHPSPAQRLCVTTRGQSPVRECRPPGSGRAATRRRTRSWYDVETKDIT